MRHSGVVVAVALLLSTVPAAGQVSRGDLIQEARVTGDEAARRDLFMEAADPAEADSLWAVSVYEIAQIMRDLGQDSVAATWIRWVTRHGQWPIDPAYFAPSLVTFAEALAADVAPDGGPDPGEAATAWRWPEAFAATEEGTVEVVSAEPGLTVAVEGRDLELGPGEPVNLPAGTYTLVVSSTEHETMRVTREVLPGAGTLVTVQPVPILADDVSERVARSLVRLRGPSQAPQACRNGVSVRDGFVLTSLSALGGATQIDVLREGLPPLAGSVVGTDPAGDLAILNVESSGAPVLSAADGLVGAAYAWTVYRSGCGPAVDVLRTRLSQAGQPAVPFPTGATGSPLIDRGGSLLGLVTGNGVIAPIERVGDLLEEAAQQLDRGGFPTVWVALGAAALGGAAALLLGGGGGGDQPDTGSIVITLPSS